jgi:hypothetical protein
MERIISECAKALREAHPFVVDGRDSASAARALALVNAAIKATQRQRLPPSPNPKSVES